jgi:type II secretory pathway component GspD/PulD (secretin)
MNRLALVLCFGLGTPLLAQEAPKEPPKEAQEAPKDAPKETQEAPKEAPKEAQEAPKDPNVGIKKRLDEQKVNLNLDSTSLQDAFEVMSDLMETPILVDASAAKAVSKGKVTMTLTDILAKNALELIETNANLEHHVWHGIVLVTKKGTKLTEPEIKPTEGLKKALPKKRITANFNETPLSEVVPFLNDLTGEKFTVLAKVDAEKVMVSFKVRDVTLGDMVAILCRVTNLTIGADDGANKLKPAEKSLDTK